MSTVDQHDLSEYHIYVGELDVGGAGGSVAHIAIPRSGQVLRVTAVATVPQITSNAGVAFQLNSVFLKKASSTASLVIPSGNSVGDIATLAFDILKTANRAREAEDGDTLAAQNSVLEVIADGGGANGFVGLVVTVGK